MAQAIKAAFVMGALTALTACSNASPEAPPEPLADVRPSVSAEDLRAQARHNPEQALKALESLGSGGDTVDERLMREIRHRAETQTFKRQVEAMEAAEDLREAVGIAIALGKADTPTNKRTLAQPLWGLVGKLERGMTRDPTFTIAAVKRLAATPALTEIVGPQFAERLKTLRLSAEIRETIRRVDAILAKGSFEALVVTLSRWRGESVKIGAHQLEAAVERAIAALEARVEAPEAEALRRDAASLWRHEQLLTGATRQRLEALLDRQGSEVLRRLSPQLKGVSISEGAERACSAQTHVMTSQEKERFERDTHPLQKRMTRGATKAARDYVQAIAKRSLMRWSRFEAVYIGVNTADLETFRDQRRPWLSQLGDLDPARKMPRVDAAKVSMCEASVRLDVTQEGERRARGSLTMCWHRAKQGWYPCRPLTIKPDEAIVRP